MVVFSKDVKFMENSLIDFWKFLEISQALFEYIPRQYGHTYQHARSDLVLYVVLNIKSDLNRPALFA